MQRRTVQTIKETLEPKKIFELICKKEWKYSAMFQEDYAVRDRAGMSLSFLTVARVTEIFGGKKFKREDGKVVCVGRHEGLKREHVELNENFLFISNMPIVKRSEKLIEKYGIGIAQRDRLAFPLKRSLFENPFYDQLVPFSWLVIEYLEKCAPEKGKFFPFQDSRAWQIINHCTEMFPNWFRAQADRFYGYYITKDSVKHSKFVGRVKAESSMPYIRYAWSEGLKEKDMAMDFDWIEPIVKEIKIRIQAKVK